MKRGDVILSEEREGGEEQGRWSETGKSHQLHLFYNKITQLNFYLHIENDQASCSQNDNGKDRSSKNRNKNSSFSGNVNNSPLLAVVQASLMT